MLAAAKVGGILANSTYPVDFLSDNLRIQVNVLDAALHNEVERVLFLGSSCIYPKFAPQPIVEDSLLTGHLEPTNDAYAIAKIAGIMQVQAVRRQYGLPWISAMPTNLYGPNDNFSPTGSHVLPALIRRYDEAVRSGAASVTNWGTGTPRREFLHADDMADACLHLLEHYDGPGQVNVGTGTDVTIREIAETTAQVVGYSGPDGVGHHQARRDAAEAPGRLEAGGGRMDVEDQSPGGTRAHRGVVPGKPGVCPASVRPATAVAVWSPGGVVVLMPRLRSCARQVLSSALRAAGRWLSRPSVRPPVVAERRRRDVVLLPFGRYFAGRADMFTRDGFKTIAPIDGVSPFSGVGEPDPEMQRYADSDRVNERVRTEVHKDLAARLAQADADYLVVDNSTALLTHRQVNGRLYTVHAREETDLMDALWNTHAHPGARARRQALPRWLHQSNEVDLRLLHPCLPGQLRPREDRPGPVPHGARSGSRRTARSRRPMSIGATRGSSTTLDDYFIEQTGCRVAAGALSHFPSAVQVADLRPPTAEGDRGRPRGALQLAPAVGCSAPSTSPRPRDAGRTTSAADHVVGAFRQNRPVNQKWLRQYFETGGASYDDLLALAYLDQGHPGSDDDLIRSCVRSAVADAHSQPLIDDEARFRPLASRSSWLAVVHADASRAGSSGPRRSRCPARASCCASSATAPSSGFPCRGWGCRRPMRSSTDGSRSRRSTSADVVGSWPIYLERGRRGITTAFRVVVADAEELRRFVLVDRLGAGARQRTSRDHHCRPGGCSGSRAAGQDRPVVHLRPERQDLHRRRWPDGPGHPHRVVRRPVYAARARLLPRRHALHLVAEPQRLRGIPPGAPAGGQAAHPTRLAGPDRELPGRGADDPAALGLQPVAALVRVRSPRRHGGHPGLLQLSEARWRSAPSFPCWSTPKKRGTRRADLGATDAGLLLHHPAPDPDRAGECRRHSAGVQLFPPGGEWSRSGGGPDRRTATGCSARRLPRSSRRLRESALRHGWLALAAEPLHRGDRLTSSPPSSGRATSTWRCSPTTSSSSKRTWPNTDSTG